MRMMDQSEAFPRRVNVDQYMPLIEAALKTAKGADNLPRVIIEDYDTYKLATRAANAIRKHSGEKKLNLHVSCPENGKSIFIYKRGEFSQLRTRKKKDEPAQPPRAPGSPEPPTPAQG